EAFRLLGSKAIAGVIVRTLALKDYPGDGRHWTFPPLVDLLPELLATAWAAALDGTLLVEGIKGERGKRHLAVLPAELPRLTPDWDLSRLRRGERDEFIDVRGWGAPAEPSKKAWRGNKPSAAAVRDAVRKIADQHPADTPPPSEPQIIARLKAVP